jgi:hypothetical protein
MATAFVRGSRMKERNGFAGERTYALAVLSFGKLLKVKPARIILWSNRGGTGFMLKYLWFKSALYS